MDIVEPLTPNKNKKYLFTIIDRNSNWFEIIPLENITANIVVNEWFSRYGYPKKITSDQGTQFESDQFKTLCSKYNIKKNQNNLI